MISRLKLKNWKSHLDSDFEFSPGVNALVGIVGSGKSSVLQAISFALFGTLAPVKARRIGLDDLIMSKPQHKKTAEVELECRVGDDTYIVKRVLEKGKGTVDVELRKNGNLLDVAAKSVTKELENALQMDFELFSKAVYSEQNELDFFLRIPRGKRTEHIDRMLKVNRFEAVREQAVGLKNRVAVQREDRIKLTKGLEDSGIEEQAGAMLEEVAGIKNGLEKAREELGKAGKEREGMENKVKVMEGERTEIDKTRSSLEVVRIQLKEMGSSIERDRKRVEGLEDLEGKMLLAEKELATLRKKKEEKGMETENAREAMAGLNARIKVTQDSLDGIKKLDGKCPVCDSMITSGKREYLADSRNREIQSLREMTGKVAVNLGKLKEEKTELDQLLVEQGMELERLSRSGELLEEIKELEKKRAEHQVRETELEKVMERLSSGFPEGALDKAKEELRGHIENESRLLEKVSGMGSLLAAKEETLAGLRERENMLKGFRDELKTDENVLESLEKFVGVLGATQEQLRQEFVKTVNAIMGEVWQEIYPYGDFDAIRLVADTDYTLELRGIDGWKAVDGVASGGERGLACLALRVAFSRAFIPNLRWLMLDEPTHNLDGRAITQLAETLRERMGSFAEQIFLVTHDERIAENVSTLYRLEREKTRNEPSKIIAG